MHHYMCAYLEINLKIHSLSFLLSKLFKTQFSPWFWLECKRHIERCFLVIAFYSVVNTEKHTVNSPRRSRRKVRAKLTRDTWDRWRVSPVSNLSTSPWRGKDFHVRTQTWWYHLSAFFLSGRHRDTDRWQVCGCLLIIAPHGVPPHSYLAGAVYIRHFYL